MTDAIQVVDIFRRLYHMWVKADGESVISVYQGEIAALVKEVIDNGNEPEFAAGIEAIGR